MFYELERGRIGILTLEELKADYVMYGFPEQTIRECERNIYNYRSNHYVAKDLIFVLVDLINLQDVFGPKSRMAIYIKEELCLIVDVKDSSGIVRKGFYKVLEDYGKVENGLKNTVPERFLYHFLNDLMVDDRTILENMELKMCGLETRMLSQKEEKDFIQDILIMKKKLMFIRNYYEQLMDVGEVLKDNENDMFMEENTKCFEIFTNRVARINDNVKGLKEYAVQLQETYDAMMDYNLNQIMKLFTVVTTIFLPLTLIVGWYGMNFQFMPELSWKYGYYGVIGVSIAVVVVCFIWFRKRHLI